MDDKLKIAVLYDQWGEEELMPFPVLDDVCLEDGLPSCKAVQERVPLWIRRQRSQS